MKVGDLVMYSKLPPAPRVIEGDHGIGIVLRVITGRSAPGTARKNPSAEVMWPTLNRVEWHAACVLEDAHQPERK